MAQDIPQKDEISIEGPDDQGMYSALFFAFSTVITMKFYLAPEAKNVSGESVVDDVIAKCRRFEWLLSRTLEKSEIYQINEARGEFVEVSPDTLKAIQLGKFYSSQSRGHFDVTMGVVTSLWNFHQEIIPAKKAIEEALQHVNWHAIDIMITDDDESPQYFVRLLDEAAKLDLGGMAKGFIADELCTLMKEQGVAGAFVNLGGNVVVFGGKPDGSPWKIGIQSPFKRDEIRGVMSLTDGSVVTSGLYERCFTKDDVFYHHILDSKTGFPVESDIAGVSVIADASSDADGYSTTLFALGSEEAIRFVDSIDSIKAIIITKDGETLTSSNIDANASM